MFKYPIFIVILILVLSLASWLAINSQSGEAAIARWNDGTTAFYRQILKSNGEFVENMGNAIFDNQSVMAISKLETENFLAKAKKSSSDVLGLHTTAGGIEKWIEIDLSDLKLYAWEGNTKVFEFLVSTGRPGYKTPSGEFRVWRKVLSQAYRGGSRERGDYYYLPNVPYSLFFGGGNVSDSKGYAIHGAYWHNDFGIKNRSSGCVNVKPEEMAVLYSWSGPYMPEGVNALGTTNDNPGVKVVIHE